MKSGNLFLILIPLALLFACGAPATLVPANPPALTPTPVPATVAPSIPPTAASTEFPPLAIAGPYFAYLRATNGGVDLVLLDANGPGRKAIALPSQVADPDPESTLQTVQISPDGKWLAFYTGSDGTCNDPSSAPGSNDLRLNLVDLSTREVKTVAKLLPSNYPQNFSANAQALIASGADTSGLDAANVASALTGAFLCGIRASAWSPDGHTLAFAGAMDGPSSDTYLYDTQSQQVTRLSSGPEEVQWLDWSPDGQWIMQGSTWAVGEGMTYNVHASSIDGKTVKTLTSSSVPGIAAWLDSHTFLVYDSANGPGDHNLRAVDVQTGEVRTLWKASFASYALDTADGLLAVSGIPDPATWTGSLILIKTANAAQLKVQDGIWNILPVADHAAAFLVKDSNTNTVSLLSSGGKLTAVQIPFGMVSADPDGKTLVSASGNQLAVYLPAGELQRTIDLPVDASNTPETITWRPDGNGLFVSFYTGDSFNVSSSSLVLVDIAAGTATLADRSSSRLTQPVLVLGGQ